MSTLKPCPPRPFTSLQGGLDKKRLHYIEGGQAGNREQYINNLVSSTTRYLFHCDQAVLHPTVVHYSALCAVLVCQPAGAGQCRPPSSRSSVCAL